MKSTNTHARPRSELWANSDSSAMAAHIASHISSGARRRSTSGTPMSKGNSVRSQAGPTIAVLPIRRGEPQAARAINTAAAIPSAASMMTPGSPPANRRTACMPPKVAPGQAMCIIRAATWIHPCD